MKKISKASIIMIMVCISIAVMTIVDGIIQPGYFYKSIIKIGLFLFLSLFYFYWSHDSIDFMTLNLKGMKQAFLLGLFVFVVIVSGYFLTCHIFDYSHLTSSLTQQTNVSIDNFLIVSLYISFVNSYLEEYFFRGFAFLHLKKYMQNYASFFSAAMFALYHIAMMIGWFQWYVLIIIVAGLFIGGLIFNYIDNIYKNIYMSWFIHMFANFAINMIGFILFLH